MSVNNFISVIWSQSIQLENERAAIIRAVANTNFEGEIQNAGDQLIFAGLADPSISAYSGTITWEELQDSSVTLNIDQQNYFAVKIDDVDKVQANQDLMGPATKRSGQLLKRTADQYAFGLYAQAGNTVTDTTTDTSTILSDISQASRYLDEKDTPMEGRWMVLAPWVKEKLELAGIVFEIRTGVDVANGVQWVNHLGFDMFVSNNVTNPVGATGSITHCLAGGTDAFVYADQLLKMKATELENSFSDGLAALHVFGAKVLRPNDLVHLALTYAAETTI